MMQQQQQPMQGGGGANPMSPQAQWELAKLMSVKDLTAVMRGQSNRVSQSIAMSALPLAMEKATADKGLMASQQLAQNPGDVNSRMLLAQQGQLPEHQGIGTLPSPNMGQVADVAMGAQGGVVGFAGGGDVQHFQVGGNRKLTAAEIAANDYYGIPAGRSFNDPVPGTSLSEKYGSIYNPIRDAASRFFSLPKNKAEEEGFVTAPGQIGISKEDILSNNPTEEGLTQLAGPQGDVAAPVKGIGRPRVEAAPSGGKGIDDLKLLPAQPALPMTDYSTSPDAPVSASAAAKPATADSAEGLKALAPVSSFEATQGIMNASTQPYMDKMSELVKGLNLSAGEKENQKYTRLGNTFLSAAQELLTSGRPGASSIGAAFGKVGTLAQDYAKEDKADKRAAIGAEISMLGAQVQVAQGNTKSAIEFFNNAEQMAFKGIELRTNTKIKNEELRLKELGIFNEKDFHNKTIQYHNAQIEEQREWHTAHIPVLRAQAGLAGAQAGYWGAAGAQNKLMLNAIGQFRKSDENLAKGVGADAKAARARLSGDGSVYAEMARRQLGFETLGLGALEPKSSIQKDTIDPADVFKVN